MARLQLDGANARVATAAAPATNSALTGLTTVSGNFWLEDGATVSPTGNVSVPATARSSSTGTISTAAGAAA